MNILFVCSRNQWRSPTGEMVWRNALGHSVRSAGTSPRAKRTMSLSDIQWADIIFVMEQKHKNRIKAAYPAAVKYKALHVLDIPDDYKKGDPELIEIIRTSTAPYLV